MSTSATSKRRRHSPARTVAGLLFASVACVIVTNVYALFGHGVRSDAMDYMFVYPLGGAAVYLILNLAFVRMSGRGFGRLGRNLLNSGIAALTLGSMFRGILEIAGGSSSFTAAFSIMGWSLTAAGILTAIYSAFLHRH